MASPTNHGRADCLMAILTTFAILFSIGLHFYAKNGPDYPHFRVDSAIFSPPLNASSSATWDLTLRVNNPNRNYSITYEQLEVLVLDLDVDELPIISTVQLPHFSQPAENTTSVPARLRGMLSEYRSSTFRVQVFAQMILTPKPRQLVGYDKIWVQCNVEFMLSGSNNVVTTPSNMCNYT